MITYIIAKLNLLFLAAPNPGDPCPLSKPKFFFIPPWWNYLQGRYDQLLNCVPNLTNKNGTFNSNDIWAIGLAIIDDLLMVAGLAAVVSIILAGAQLVMAEGNPEKATSARNRLIHSVLGLAIAFSGVALVALVSNTLGGSSSPNGLPTTSTAGQIKNILDVVFAIIGALAFLYIVIAGFRYVISGDNPNKVAEARRQILYAALGLLVVALAATIANYVIDKLATP